VIWNGEISKVPAKWHEVTKAYTVTGNVHHILHILIYDLRSFSRLMIKKITKNDAEHEICFYITLTIEKNIECDPCHIKFG